MLSAGTQFIIFDAQEGQRAGPAVHADGECLAGIPGLTVCKPLMGQVFPGHGRTFRIIDHRLQVDPVPGRVFHGAAVHGGGVVKDRPLHIQGDLSDLPLEIAHGAQGQRFAGVDPVGGCHRQIAQGCGRCKNRIHRQIRPGAMASSAHKFRIAPSMNNEC